MITAVGSWLALAVGGLTVVLGIRIAREWRDWKLIPLVGGLVAVCTGPIVDILARNRIIDDAALHDVAAYRSIFAAVIALVAVISLRRLIEHERGLRKAVERTDALARSHAELERELDNRREAEQTVLEAQTRLSAILDNTPATIFIKDLEGRYLYLNQPRAFSEQAEFVAALLGKTDADVFPADVAAELRASDVEAARTRAPVETEQAFSGLRGERTYLTVKFPLRDADGGIYAIAGVSRDITRRAETTKTVHRIFQLCPALMCTLDAQGRFVTVNPAFHRMLGYAESEIIGRSYDAFVHPDDLEATRAEGRKLQAGAPTIIDHENRYRARDGTYRTLAWYTTYVPAERTFYASAADVTSKVLQREAIRRIYELAPVAMATFDWRGFLLAVNPVLPRILGYTAEEMVGHEGIEFVHPDDVAVFRSQGLALSARAATLSAFEGRVRCKDGSYRTLSWDVSSAPDDRSFYAVARDVTQVRNKEQQLAKGRDAMAHELRLRTIGELASEMSHELNQPLGAIVNFARGLTTRLRAGTIAHDDAMAIIEKIAGQALRGGDLIRKILIFARRDDMVSQEHSLNDVVRDTITLLGAGGTLRAEVVLGLDETLPPVRMDRAQIQQVIFNLVRNALDAVDASADRRVEIRTALDGESDVRLSISDNGPGVLPADSERIFDAFYTTRPGGVGLGLPISRSIVQAHDGRLWVESAPGAGTTFHVALPLIAEPFAAAAR